MVGLYAAAGKDQAGRLNESSFNGLYTHIYRFRWRFILIYLKGPQCCDGLYLTIAKMVGSMQRKSMKRSMAR